MMSFTDIPLPNEIQAALSDLGFKNPTKIQSAVIPVVQEGKDLIATAETGSGKTAGYSIPMVARLLAEPETNALILAPTRELAHQIADFVRDLTAHCKKFPIISLVGGTDIRKQLQGLKRKPRVVIATPGRLTDHLKRKSIHLKNTEMLVLDEGDRMLDMGFAPQIDEILKYLPKKRQTLLFSATMLPKVQQLAERSLDKPLKVQVGRSSLPVESIKQSVAQVSFKEKDDRIIDELNQRQGSIIVFCRTKNRTDILEKILKSYGFPVGLIHGGRTQGQRNKAIRDFKAGKTRILCATDVAARGIDVPSVAHVINFDLPMMEEDYVHRIGRTARNGAEGEALSFVMPDEVYTWNALAKRYKIPDVRLERSKKSKPFGKRSGSVGKFTKKPYGNRRNRDEESPQEARSFKKRGGAKTNWPGQKKDVKKDNKKVADILEFEESFDRSQRTPKKKSKENVTYGKQGRAGVEKKRFRDREDNESFDFRKKKKKKFAKDVFGRSTNKKKKSISFKEKSDGESSPGKKKGSSSKSPSKNGSSSLKKKSSRDFVKSLSGKKATPGKKKTRTKPGRNPRAH